jgi:hypothetical protein
MTEKKCYTCQSTKPIDCFWKHKNEIGGRKNQCVECCKKHKKSTYEKYREKYREKCREYSRNHYDELYEKTKQYRKDNIDKCREWARRSSKKRWQKNKHNPKYRLDGCIATAIGRCLRGEKNYRKWQQLVGYSINELCNHLQSLFLPGMTWENYGEWHVDHIKPKSWFTYQHAEDKQFLECWSLKNLQPLWSKDNESKGNRFRG